MKLGLLARVLSGATIASLTVFTAVTFSHQPTYAGGATFYCGTSKYRGGIRLVIPIRFKRV